MPSLREPDHLPPSLRDSLAPWLESVVFSTGTVFRQGDVGDACFFLTAGQVRIEAHGERGECDIDSEPVLGYLGAGEAFGELALLDGEPRAASAFVETAPVHAWKLTAASVETLRARHPDIAADLYRYLGTHAAAKLRSTNVTATGQRGGEDPEVDALVTAAADARKAFSLWPDDRVEALLARIAEVSASRAGELADLTVRATRYGNVPDKTRKNLMAALGVLHSMTGHPGAGVIAVDETRGITEIAAPAGVVFALIPITNPVATAVFKALVCLKSRNALILSFHRAAREVAGVVGEMLEGILIEAGAPAGLIGWVKDRNSRRKTAAFFRHPGVDLILATGGRAMVRAAYASGKPALGVGPGNTPTLICGDCDPGVAAAMVVESKSFDHGLICGAEHNLIVVDSIYDAFIAALEASGAAVLTDPDESTRFMLAVLTDDGTSLRRKTVGQSGADIAAMADLERPFPIRVLVVPAGEAHSENALAREKMAPVLGLFRVADETAGFALAARLLEIEGAGHTAIIHSRNRETIRAYAEALPVGRILANSPGAQGVVGLTTGLIPSLTLGCGTFGGTSTTDNVTYLHVRNIKRLAEFRSPSITL